MDIYFSKVTQDYWSDKNNLQKEAKMLARKMERRIIPGSKLKEFEDELRTGIDQLNARLHFLEKILDIQNRVNDNAPVKDFYLIDSEEESRIRELIAMGAYPQKWSGEEPTGDIILDNAYSDGSVMPILFRDWVGKSSLTI